jgi:hypothetical protein
MQCHLACLENHKILLLKNKNKTIFVSYLEPQKVNASAVHELILHLMMFLKYYNIFLYIQITIVKSSTVSAIKLDNFGST